LNLSLDSDLIDVQNLFIQGFANKEACGFHGSPKNLLNAHGSNQRLWLSKKLIWLSLSQAN
jgi:hypothetical protein